MSSSLVKGSIADVTRERATPRSGLDALPTPDKKTTIDLEHLNAMRRFLRQAVDGAVFTLRELENRVLPYVKHAEGCPAVADDNLHCLMGCPDRELRLTCKTIAATLGALVDAAPVRRFGKMDYYAFPSREGYTALVTELEYLRTRVAEFQSADKTKADVKVAVDAAIAEITITHEDVAAMAASKNIAPADAHPAKEET